MMKALALFALVTSATAKTSIVLKTTFLHRTPLGPGYEADDALLIPEIDINKSYDFKDVEAREGSVIPGIPPVYYKDGGTPVGGAIPHVPPHVVEWKESELPLLLQWSLAGLWILMLASLPFIIRAMDHKPVTNTQIIVGALMLIVLFGGFYLFTNIILFQSVHFKQIRPLTIVECIYFMTQVITTVGYGDITPAKIRGQVFVGMYVLGALFIISMLISDLTSHMIAMAQDYKKKLAMQKKSAQQGSSELEKKKQQTIRSLAEKDKPSAKGLMTALTVFAILDICWILFFSLHPGENKTVFQAVYMSVITLSTVGFGWFTPITETGMIFGSFFMLFGSAALVNVIGNFTELMVKMNEWERCRPESSSAVLESLDSVTKGSETVTESQFYQFALLQMKCVSQAELDHIREAFQQLNPSITGIVSTKAIYDSLATESTAAADASK